VTLRVGEVTEAEEWKLRMAMRRARVLDQQ
jgi:hypothetical protein